MSVNKARKAFTVCLEALKMNSLQLGINAYRTDSKKTSYDQTFLEARFEFTLESVGEHLGDCAFEAHGDGKRLPTFLMILMIA